jgi:hypothetical protein
VTHLYIYYRCGVDVKLVTVRRKHYLPNALCNIGSIDPLVASRYNVPQAYKQNLSCPHKAYWRTAMELKMESYEAIPVWNLVSIKAVSKPCRPGRGSSGSSGSST